MQGGQTANEGPDDRASWGRCPWGWSGRRRECFSALRPLRCPARLASLCGLIFLFFVAHMRVLPVPIARRGHKIRLAGR